MNSLYRITFRELRHLRTGTCIENYSQITNIRYGIGQFRLFSHSLNRWYIITSEYEENYVLTSERITSFTYWQASKDYEYVKSPNMP